MRPVAWLKGTHPAGRRLAAYALIVVAGTAGFARTETASNRAKRAAEKASTAIALLQADQADRVYKGCLTSNQSRAAIKAGFITLITVAAAQAPNADPHDPRLAAFVTEFSKQLELGLPQQECVAPEKPQK